MLLLLINSIHIEAENQEPSNQIKDKKQVYSVALISQLYRSGGLERVTQLLAQYLSQEQIKVYLITGEPTDQDYEVPENVERLVAYVENDGINEETMNEVVRVKTEEKNQLLLQYAKQYNIKLFVCQEHWALGHYSTINFLKDHNIKVIAIEHNFFMFPIHSHREHLYRYSVKTYPRLDALVCLSRVDVQLWRKVGVKNAIYIPNLLTFDPSQVQPSNLTTNNIIMVGRFNKDQKQQHLAIYMMSFLVKIYPEAVLQLIGEWTHSYFKECLKIVHVMNLTNNVIFIPFQKDIVQYYQNASVLIMTSKTEGFPMVMLEAKAFGVPVVAFDLTFCELWQEGVTTVWQGDIPKMAEKIAEILIDKDLRMQRGRESKESLQRFDNAVTVQKWVTLIKGIIDGNPDTIPEIQETEEKVTYERALEVLKHELKANEKEGYDFGFEL
ncbi:Glycosyl_transferases group [Hexamita inflata]|uniref:Glycosyl transferases group n=1 Tax=Hexamita inflata TaxID=28002 RepID=A0AA86VL76_9EUKA|nr:Glycosyl transferases group [Hexamita inflata]